LTLKTTGHDLFRGSLDRVIEFWWSMGPGTSVWLDHMVEQTQGFERVDPAPYLRRALDRP